MSSFNGYFSLIKNKNNIVKIEITFVSR